jgi:hypothetical protein
MTKSKEYKIQWGNFSYGPLKQKSDIIKCPFCGEDGFDLIGLKAHLECCECNVYNSIVNVKRIFS